MFNFVLFYKGIVLAHITNVKQNKFKLHINLIF